MRNGTKGEDNTPEFVLAAVVRSTNLHTQITVFVGIKITHIKKIMSYDSQADTLLHIKRVSQLLNEAAVKLIERGNVHDNSKLEEPEKSEFDRLTPLLKTLTFGSEEYKESLKELEVALTHHYENNTHHPQHYENGINGFDLFDLVEMFFDWKAASERTKDGNIYKSIEHNKDRFEISDQICQIFENTAKRLGW